MRNRLCHFRRQQKSRRSVVRPPRHHRRRRRPVIRAVHFHRVEFRRVVRQKIPRRHPRRIERSLPPSSSKRRCPQPYPIHRPILPNDPQPAHLPPSTFRRRENGLIPSDNLYLHANKPLGKSVLSGHNLHDFTCPKTTFTLSRKYAESLSTSISVSKKSRDNLDTTANFATTGRSFWKMMVKMLRSPFGWQSQRLTEPPLGALRYS